MLQSEYRYYVLRSFSIIIWMLAKHFGEDVSIFEKSLRKQVYVADKDRKSTEWGGSR